MELTAWQKGTLSAHLGAETRWDNDSSQLNNRLFGSKLYWQADKVWQVGLGYTWFSFRSGNGYDNEHRMETELNPSWHLTDWVTLSLRNRLELRFQDGPGKSSDRFRQRTGLIFPLKHLGPLTSAYINDEGFWDFGRHEVNQNRFTPIGLNFSLGAHSHLSLYYLIQSLKSGAGDWECNHVLGTQLSFDLK